MAVIVPAADGTVQRPNQKIISRKGAKDAKKSNSRRGAEKNTKLIDSLRDIHTAYLKLLALAYFVAWREIKISSFLAPSRLRVIHHSFLRVSA